MLPRSCANDHFPRVSAIVGRTQETFVDNSGRRRSLFGYAFGDLDVGAFWDQILRKKTGRKPGRPKGQPGATMSLIDHPDHVIRHEPGCCGRCSAGLGGASVTVLRGRGPGRRPRTG